MNASRSTEARISHTHHTHTNQTWMGLDSLFEVKEIRFEMKELSFESFENYIKKTILYPTTRLCFTFTTKWTHCPASPLGQGQAGVPCPGLAERSVLGFWHCGLCWLWIVTSLEAGDGGVVQRMAELKTQWQWVHNMHCTTYYF